MIKYQFVIPTKINNKIYKKGDFLEYKILTRNLALQIKKLIYERKIRIIKEIEINKKKHNVIGDSKDFLEQDIQLNNKIKAKDKERDKK